MLHSLPFTTLFMSSSNHPVNKPQGLARNWLDLFVTLSAVLWRTIIQGETSWLHFSEVNNLFMVFLLKFYLGYLLQETYSCHCSYWRVRLSITNQCFHEIYISAIQVIFALELDIYGHRQICDPSFVVFTYFLRSWVWDFLLWESKIIIKLFFPKKIVLCSWSSRTYKEIRITIYLDHKSILPGILCHIGCVQTSADIWFPRDN